MSNPSSEPRGALSQLTFARRLPQQIDVNPNADVEPNHQAVSIDYNLLLASQPNFKIVGDFLGDGVERKIKIIQRDNKIAQICLQGGVYLHSPLTCVVTFSSQKVKDEFFSNPENKHFAPPDCHSSYFRKDVVTLVLDTEAIRKFLVSVHKFEPFDRGVIHAFSEVGLDLYLLSSLLGEANQFPARAIELAKRAQDNGAYSLIYQLAKHFMERKDVENLMKCVKSIERNNPKFCEAQNYLLQYYLVSENKDTKNYAQNGDYTLVNTLFTCAVYSLPEFPDNQDLARKLYAQMRDEPYDASLVLTFKNDNPENLIALAADHRKSKAEIKYLRQLLAQAQLNTAPVVNRVRLQSRDPNQVANLSSAAPKPPVGTENVMSLDE